MSTARHRTWLEDWRAKPPVVVEAVEYEAPAVHDHGIHYPDSWGEPCPHPEHEVVRRLQARARELGLGADGLVFSRRCAVG